MHASNFETQTTLRVGIIDTGYNMADNLPICDSHQRKGKQALYYTVGTSMQDERDHGQNVARLIYGNVDDARFKFCFIIIKVFAKTGPIVGYEKALETLHSEHPDFVNLSFGGYSADPVEKVWVEKMQNAGALIVAAAGNDGRTLNKVCNYFPACTNKNVIVVGQYDFDGTNRGPRVDIYASAPTINRSTGSSYAAAIVTGKLISTQKRTELKRK
jgi:subtilisin family serine protease